MRSITLKGLSLISFALVQMNEVGLAQVQNATPGIPKSKSVQSSTLLEIKGTKNILLVVNNSKTTIKPFSKSQSKLEKEKELIEQIFQVTPKSLNFGLRLYGCEERPSEEGKNSSLVFSVHAKTRKDIQQRIRNLESEGMSTPLTFALSQVLEKDIANIEGETLVILFCDAVSKNSIEYFRSRATNGTLPAKILVVDLHESRNLKEEIAKYPKFERLLRHEFDRDGGLMDVASLSGGKYYPSNKLSDLIQDLKSIKK